MVFLGVCSFFFRQGWVVQDSNLYPRGYEPNPDFEEFQFVCCNLSSLGLSIFQP